jgi:hypothetical protein
VTEPSFAAEDADELLVIDGSAPSAAGCASCLDRAAILAAAGVAGSVTQGSGETATPTRVIAFSDRVAEAVERKRSQLVVGLDPRVDLLPVELRGEAVLGRAPAAAAVERFCKGIVDAVAPYAVAVKPQVAFFEVLGSTGGRRSSPSAGMRPRPGCW